MLQTRFANLPSLPSLLLLDSDDMMKATQICRIILISLLTSMCLYYDAVNVDVRAGTSNQLTVLLTADNGMPPLPLAKLVKSDSAADASCPPYTAPILDTIFDDEYLGRSIPHIIHMTSRSD